MAAVLGICKHHSGLYEHLASHVIDALLHYTQAEPESWPPKAFELVLVTPLQTACPCLPHPMRGIQ